MTLKWLSEPLGTLCLKLSLTMSRKCTGASAAVSFARMADATGWAAAPLAAGAVEAALEVTTEETAEDMRLSIGCGTPAHRRDRERDAHTLSQRERLLILIFHFFEL